jgi:hypothetical protein
LLVLALPGRRVPSSVPALLPVRVMAPVWSGQPVAARLLLMVSSPGPLAQLVQAYSPVPVR